MSDYDNDYNSYDSGSHYDGGSSSYYSDMDNQPQKKPSKHTGLKILGILMCLGLLSAGSIQVYKFMTDVKLEEFDARENTDRQNDEAETQIAEEVSKNVVRQDDNLPSLIQIASRTDAKYLPDIVDEITPSVVGVASTFEYKQSYTSWGWGGFAPETRTEQISGTGTGIILSEDGYVVTNAHVIYDDSEYKCGKAIDVSVLLSDESKHEATIIAYDVETDIAVLKIDESGLTPATFGDSSDLRVGELVIAVGNPLGFDLFGTVTSGIVSALNREISINEKNMTLIQTDAAINSGNSGGPLLNSCGQVIGINSAKMSSSYGSASVEGLGFAIPINEAKVIIDDLINFNYVKGRPQIGIASVDVTEAYSSYLNIPMGVYVRDVSADSAAEQAGIKPGDIIIGIAGETVTTTEELNKVKNRYKAGDTITLTVSRDGEDIDLSLTLQEATTQTDEDNPLEKEEPKVGN